VGTARAKWEIGAARSRQVGKALNAPRDIGLVSVSKDMKDKTVRPPPSVRRPGCRSAAAVVAPPPPPRSRRTASSSRRRRLAQVFSTGKTETSGFYTFGGTWSNQTVVGVQWLTAHATTTTTNAAGVATESYNENACRLKATRIGTGATHARAARFTITRFERAGGRRHPLCAPLLKARQPPAVSAERPPRVGHVSTPSSPSAQTNKVVRPDEARA
jgi:hypothetical protein